MKQETPHYVAFVRQHELEGRLLGDQKALTLWLIYKKYSANKGANVNARQ